MANKKYYTGKSKIQGKGAFAKQSLKPGDFIGKVHTINQPYVDYDFTDLGRNHNHSENPNVQNVLVGNERHLVATKPIKKGQELTSNYRLQPDLEQPEDFKKGGWLDKYSPTAENGIEGTMGGLTDKGFNYNGAWGGQFQDGGEIDEQAFQNFFKTLPANLRIDAPDYNIRGYWDALGRPSEFDYSQGKQEDGKYHAFSRHPRTGEILKSPQHPTFKMAIEEDRKAGYLPIVTPEGTVKTVNEQFQMGGNVYPVNYVPQSAMGSSIPGSVGFTYARTNSPAPSEGPYAKKTLPSAQNGTVEDIANSSREDMLRFYAERPQDLQIPEIEESLKKIKVKGKSPMFMDIFQGGALGYYNPIGNVIGYNTDPNIADLEGGVEETLKHEFGHKAFSKLPKEMRQIVKESILPSEEVAEGLGVKKKFARYVTTPTEFYTRRRSAIEGLGIDPSKKISQEEAEKLVDFTNAVNSIYTGKPNPKENYNKFKEAYPEKVEMLEKLRAYPGSEEAFQFIKSIKNTPETYMQMFNDVTAVPGETVPMAQNGREMSYYQHGLDWKPKTISRNGGWLDKYVPEAQDGKDVEDRLKQVKENFEEGKNFLRDWYTQRAELPQFKDVATARAEDVDRFGYSYEPYKKMKKLGAFAYYDSGKDKDSIFLLDPNDPDIPATRPSISYPGVVSHEIIHGLQFKNPQFGVDYTEVPFEEFNPDYKHLKKSKNMYDWINTKGPAETVDKEGNRKIKFEKGVETEATFGMLRMAEKLNPKKTYSPEDITPIVEKYKNFSKEHMKDPKNHNDLIIHTMMANYGFDPVKIAELQNSIVGNISNRSDVAKHGGYIKSKEIENQTKKVNQKHSGSWLDGYK